MQVSEKTHQAVLPQRLALEPVLADKPRGRDETSHGRGRKPATDLQHGRGEIPARGRHLCPAGLPAGAENGSLTAPTAVPKPVAARVFVLDRHGKPLDPCHPARARRLLSSGRAVVAHHTPFVIRLKDREAESSRTSHLVVKIDPGSRHTGVALARQGLDGALHGLIAVQVDHRAQKIKKALTKRRGLRRGRRSRNLRYRAPRFSNRHPSKCASCGANAQAKRDRCRPCQEKMSPRQDGLRPLRLAPSLRHIVEADAHMVSKLLRWAPVGEVVMELVRFDTQAMENPEISGVEYQQGTLAGYEVREYLLEKWGRSCAYCGASGVPLNIDHIHPRSRGGTDRVSNLTLACVRCNQDKGALPVEEFLAHDPARLKRVLAQAKAPLKDAAAVNSTRWELYQRLKATGFPVVTGTGGQTKWSRGRHGLPKSHTLDALCAGGAPNVASYPDSVVVAAARGRGGYSRTRLTKSGFPRLRLPRKKSHHGFQTGDYVKAVVPSGKKAGSYVGRVVVRSRGSFDIETHSGKVEGIGHRRCRLLQRSDGWGWSRQPERITSAT